MKNSAAKESIQNCLDELDKIQMLIEGMGKTSNPVPFLTKYAIIKACGTIEFCFKTIIADAHLSQSPQVRNFIDKMFRKSSINPSLDRIHKSLNNFDEGWSSNFKKSLEKLPNKAKVTDSLQSLNEARNTFAHGGHPSSSFDNVRTYFEDSVEIIKILDGVVI
jgi:hypothetical protein